MTLRPLPVGVVAALVVVVGVVVPPPPAPVGGVVGVTAGLADCICICCAALKSSSSRRRWSNSTGLVAAPVAVVVVGTGTGTEADAVELVIPDPACACLGGAGAFLLFERRFLSISGPRPLPPALDTSWTLGFSRPLPAPAPELAADVAPAGVAAVGDEMVITVSTGVVAVAVAGVVGPVWAAPPPPPPLLLAPQPAQISSPGVV